MNHIIQTKYEKLRLIKKKTPTTVVSPVSPGWTNTFRKKSRIRETKNLSTDADSRTDTILERLRDLSKTKYIYSTRKNWPKGRFFENPAYGRQRTSRPMRIVGLIQFWRG